MLYLLLKRDYASAWLIFLWAALHAGICQDAGLLDFELFSTYTFEVKEGFLLSQGKVIGNVDLTKENDSEYFLYDEPQFGKPNNTKRKPRPQYFEVVFLNASAPEDATTEASRVRRAEEASGTQPESDVTFVTPMPHHDNASTTVFDAATDVTTPGVNTSEITGTYFSTMTTSLHMTSIVTSPGRENISVTPTVSEDVGKVVAQIKQVYDLDREKSDTHYLTINRYTGDGALTDLPTIVVIKVTDINDNSPIFVKESLYSEISKDAMMGQIVAEIKATDADIGENANLRYDIMGYSERINNATERPVNPTFMMEEKRGLVFLMNALDDFEVPSIVTFKIVVTDRGDSKVANRATATATVAIIDPTPDPPPPSAAPETVSAVVIALSTAGGVIAVGIIAFVLYWCRRSKRRQNDGQLELMLNDDNLMIG